MSSTEIAQSRLRQLDQAIQETLHIRNRLIYSAGNGDSLGRAYELTDQAYWILREAYEEIRSDLIEIERRV